MSPAGPIAVDFGLFNVEAALEAAASVELPFHVACALLQKESGGRNVYGHDHGGVFSFPGRTVEVTAENFKEFRHRIDAGEPSNGVGPCQITAKGFFPQAQAQGLKLWRPLDNMTFGFRLLRNHHRTHGTWDKAGTVYNAGNLRHGVTAYGRTFASFVEQWQERLAHAPGPVAPAEPTRTVVLANVVAAFHADPDRPQGHGLHPDDVRPVEQALQGESLLPSRLSADGYAGTATRQAYRQWQQRRGHHGNDADGIPGRETLQTLGGKHGFAVA